MFAEEAAATISAPNPLRDRLRAALQQPLRGTPAPRIESVTELSDLSMLGGRWFQSPLGPGYVVESVYEPGHEHGRIALHRALTVDPMRLAGQTKDARLGDQHPRDFLYVDTETTGLGGAGSMVFLAGVARFDGSLLKLRQYLLPAPQYEGGLLGGLGEELAGRGGAGQLQRQVVRPAHAGIALHPLAAEACVQATAASRLAAPQPATVQGHVRFAQADAHGTRTARLRTRRRLPIFRGARALFPLPAHERPDAHPARLRHNAWDILSLVALAAHLAAVCDGDEQPFQAARAAEYAGDDAAAVAWYERALGGRLQRDERLEAMEHCARLQGRLGRWEESAGWWQAMIDEPRCRRLRPYVELAKIAEHRQKDFAAAYVVVSQAVSLASRGLIRPGAPGSDVSVEALEHRKARLEAALRRRSARAVPNCRAYTRLHD